MNSLKDSLRAIAVVSKGHVAAILAREDAPSAPLSYREVVRLVRELVLVVDHDVNDLRYPRRQVRPHAPEHRRPLVPEPPLQPQDDRGTVELHEVDPARDPHAAILFLVPEHRPAGVVVECLSFHFSGSQICGFRVN